MSLVPVPVPHSPGAMVRRASGWTLDALHAELDGFTIPLPGAPYETAMPRLACLGRSGEGSGGKGAAVAAGGDALMASEDADQVRRVAEAGETGDLLQRAVGCKE